MTGGWRALLRLLAVQGTWNYERMLGVGMGYAAEPLLEDLKTVDPVRHGEAVVRSAEFFNCNPNLAGLALGATVRAEYDGVPGEKVARLRLALCSPLGALGDQLFWAGLVPALSGLAIAAVALGAGAWAPVGMVLVYAIVRLATALWALRTGLAAGMDVGRAIGASWLPRAIPVAGVAAAFAVGLALPLAAHATLDRIGPGAAAAVVAVAAATILAPRFVTPKLTAVRFALLAAGLLILLRRVVA